MKYRVHLNIPTALLGRVEVEAANPTEAGIRALELAAKGDIAFEHPSVEYAKAEISDVAESE
jgi:hypothetical protein